MTSDHAAPVRDDRILPVTRVVAALVSLSVFGGFVLLYIRPDLTTLLWAWTIEPTLTPMMMGGGYLSGAYFFWRVVRGQSWRVVSLGFPSVGVFAWFMMTATVLHWGEFNHRHINFFAWVVLYAITPLLVPAIWWLNHRHDPGRGPEDVLLPSWIRGLLGVAGVTTFVVVLIGFAQPERTIAIWPWALTTFTARIVVSWFTLAAMFGISTAIDGRWMAMRLPLLSALIAAGAMLLAVARSWEELDPANPLRVALVVALVVAFPAVFGLTAWMDSRQRAS